MRISASKLTNYYNCPRKYWYSTQMKAKKPGKALQTGLKVHALLEGQDVKGILSADEKWFYQALDDLRTREGYTILYPEEKQVFEWEGFTVARVIDALGFDKEGVPVLIDYKTGSSAWAQPYVGICPKAMGVQSQMYFIPPDEAASYPKEFKGEWPTRIDYLVASKNFRGSKAEVISYEYNEKHFEEFKALLENFKRTAGAGESIEDFPPLYGFLCGYCDYAKVCLKGDERGYVKYD